MKVINNLVKWITNKFFIAAIIILALVIWLAPALNKEHPQVPVINQNFTVSPFKVLVEVVELQSIEPFIALSGLVKSENNLSVRSQSSGTVKHIAVRRGQFVEKDTLLVELDEQESKAVLEQANANYQTQNINYETEKNLYEKGLTSKSKLSAAESNFKSAKALLDRAQLNFNNRLIKAELTGEVNDLHVELGDFVSVGSSIAEIVDLTNLKIQAELLPEQLNHLKKINEQYENFEVLINHPYNQSLAPIKGKLAFVYQKANPNSRSYPIEVLILESKSEFSLEQWAEFKILLPNENAYPMARSLISIDSDGDFSVDLVNDQNQVQSQKIEVIKDDGNRVWVVGLENNQRIITRGAGFVSSGDTVTIVSN